MAGWTPEKAAVFKEEFYGFLGDVRINSKEKGPIILGENLYRAQHRFFDAVFDGLVSGVHDFKHTKSRQLGISTGSRMLTLFWAGVHHGLRGYMVFDTGPHAEEARLELLDALKSLPRHRKFPRVERENRNLIELSNGTRINFAAAGVKETKTSGTLGRSSGINFVHASEVCSWAGGEGLVAFQNALAQDFPDRLYIWESTGRGYNLWYEMYEGAKSDHRQRALFSGWWAKDNQIITPDDPDFERYGRQAPTQRELRRMQTVKQLYGWQITREQLAWVRRNSDPTPDDNGDAPQEYEATAAQSAEQAWVDTDCFQLPGSQFFSSEALQRQANQNVRHKFLTYSFFHGIEFADLRVEKSRNNRSIELKVWEEPIEDSVYCVTADPAFGYNENNDRSAIQVCRCYADGLEQVAEYAWPLITTDQFAHVILGIAAWYAGDRSQVYLMVELNGPGEAVWKEIRNVQTKIKMPYFAAKMAEKGLGDIFRNVRNYIYSRPDSMSAGAAWMWKCLALDTALPTPDGWTTMGKVKAGDTLLDEQARPCKVLRATGAMQGHPCYEVSFLDGTSIVADDQHQWLVADGDLVQTVGLRPGRDVIIGAMFMHSITAVEPVDSVHVKCIEVDSPSHLYLAGEGMVPTHNTGPQQKETMMNQLQAATDNGTLCIRSMAALEEMRSVQRDGGSIEATGSNKDDRVLALAMAVVCWFERVRGKMMQARRTRDFEQSKHNLSVVDRVQMFNQSQLDQFFATKAVARKQAYRAALNTSRRR